jgi:hypothetical protein
LFQAFVMAVPLGLVLVAATAFGMGYLTSAMLDRRWRAAWACAVSAAAVVEVTFVAFFVVPIPPFGQLVAWHASWGMLAFSAAFVAAGIAMVAVITSAARQGLADGRRRVLWPGALMLVIACLGTAAWLARDEPRQHVIYTGPGPDALAITPDGRTLPSSSPAGLSRAGGKSGSGFQDDAVDGVRTTDGPGRSCRPHRGRAGNQRDVCRLSLVTAGAGAGCTVQLPP